jgi:hypothetical protein
VFTRDQLPPMREEQKCAGTPSTNYSTQFLCPYGHNTTLQHYRLYSVTVTVTKPSSERTS